MFAIIVLIVERHPMQLEDVERDPGRKRVLKATKRCGAVSSAAQTAGKTENAERLGHREPLERLDLSAI